MAPQTTSQRAIVVREIESRVEQLIADHKHLTMLNGELIQQRNQLLASKQEMQERIAKLEKELAMAQLKSGLNGRNTKSNARARAYINRLLREVDTCITLLSSPEEASEEAGNEREASEEAGNERGASEERGANEREASEERGANE